MKTFSAKQLHENPSEVYRAAAREPVKITHRCHGEMYLLSKDGLAECIENCLGIAKKHANVEEFLGDA